MIQYLEQKKLFYENDVNRYDEELKRISSNISTLSNARSQSIQVRDTSVAGGVRTTISTSELRMAAKRIEVEEQNRKGVQSKREVASDSLQSIQLRILDLESMEGVSSELGPLEYLSGLLNKPMDQIINWFILIIIFVFDPLAVALVIAFNNAVLVDRGIVKKDKVIRRRELYDEVPEEEVMDELDKDEDDTDGWENDSDVQEFLEREDSYESDDSDELFTVAGMTNDKEQSFNEFQKIQDEFDERDLNKDGIVTEAEERESYKNGGWKNAYNGKPFYHHPWFDWSKTQSWINDRAAINYWMKSRGGSQGQLTKLKQSYPEDFTTKTY